MKSLQIEAQCGLCICKSKKFVPFRMLRLHVATGLWLCANCFRQQTAAQKGRAA